MRFGSRLCNPSDPLCITPAFRRNAPTSATLQAYGGDVMHDPIRMKRDGRAWKCWTVLGGGEKLGAAELSKRSGVPALQIAEALSYALKADAVRRNQPKGHAVLYWIGPTKVMGF
jgi:hypothetical protein